MTRRLPVRIAFLPARRAGRCRSTRLGFLLVGGVLAGVSGCRPPAPPEPTWQVVDPLTFSAWAETVLQPSAQAPDYWRQKPLLAATYQYDLSCPVSREDREIVARFQNGEFRPYHVYEWLPIGVPPPWAENPLDNTSWDFYRHSLRWLAPVVDVWRTDGSTAAYGLVERTLRDWAVTNSKPPGGSAYAWYDHSVSTRLRLLAWFWEVWRTTDAFDPEFAELLLGMVYQHALYAADPATYPGDSNHALEMDTALYAAAITFPEFCSAGAWKSLALQRIAVYAEGSFSPEGFHLEQSPFYHWYVLDRFDKFGRFVRQNGEMLPEPLIAPLRRIAAAWPYLLKPDGTLPTIGDTPVLSRRRDAFDVELVGGAAAVRDAAPRPANPRADNADFLLSFAAGYAIFAARPLTADGGLGAAPDTYAVFKCNSFRSPHFHHDALSFVLYGLGQDWLVDAGQLNYEERTPERQYMRSARAHNVLLIDGADFTLRPIELISSGRTDAGDFVTVRHELESAQHTRTFRFVPPDTIEIEDEVLVIGDQPRSCTQLFHAAPDLEVSIADEVVTLTGAAGASCTISQIAGGGAWTVVHGQRAPILQGWYSPTYNELRANAALMYTARAPQQRHSFRTRIVLLAP